MLDDEVRLGNENRYKNYVVAIEKVLKQFESSNEWTDLVRYLDRLKKVSRAHCNCKVFVSESKHSELSFSSPKVYRDECTISISTKTYHCSQTSCWMSTFKITIRCSFKNIESLRNHLSNDSKTRSTTWYSPLFLWDIFSPTTCSINSQTCSIEHLRIVFSPTRRSIKSGLVRIFDWIIFSLRRRCWLLRSNHHITRSFSQSNWWILFLYFSMVSDQSSSTCPSFGNDICTESFR